VGETAIISVPWRFERLNIERKCGQRREAINMNERGIKKYVTNLCTELK
jgi:hypothetical protein